MVNNKSYKNLSFYLILITYAVLLIMLFVYRENVFKLFNSVLTPLYPFFLGIGIAYVLNLPMRFLEENLVLKIFKKNPKKKLVRTISLISSFIFALAVLTAIFAIIIPQIAVSVVTLANNFDSYITSLSGFLDRVFELFNINADFWGQFDALWQSWFNEGIEYLKNSLPTIFNVTKDFTTGLVGGIVNTFVGIVICAYVLFNKEQLIAQLKNFMYAFLPQKANDYILKVGRYANITFGKFISGQITEAFVVGILCFIGMTILGLPYALLISVIVGFTNMIPIIGPIIGAIPGAFILLMINPVQSLWFVIFMIVLQQIDSNLIYPHVVGNSVGLSGLWVMFAIFVGGGLFGFMGIFLGVPTFAVIYKLLGKAICDRISKKSKKNEEMISVTDDISDI